jgi:hypothetical protein
MTVPTTPPRRKVRPVRLILGLGLLIVLIVIIASALGGSPAPTFKATIESITAPTPKTLIVVIHVTNTSGTAGKPSCSIQALAPTGASGETSFAATKTLPARTEASYRMYLRITTTRATRITENEMKVTC